jgi:ABC-type Fe3+-siderophore transport system permease subunit
MSKRGSHTIARFGLLVARVASAAWVGAAVLFVITAVREVRHAGFDSATKDTLALLRFPAYYAVGFALVSIALAGCTFALTSRKKETNRPRLIVVAAGLLAVVLALMVADFMAIYVPMVGMITPVGRSRPDGFETYHRASMAINVCDVAVCALAAILLCWQNAPDESVRST